MQPRPMVETRGLFLPKGLVAIFDMISCWIREGSCAINLDDAHGDKYSQNLNLVFDYCKAQIGSA